jgi:ABC-type multidrug transport system fused ATPase/permease subunit
MDNFRDRQIRIATENLSLGIYSLATIFGSVAILGWAAENLIDIFKTRALANVLMQEGAFFDRQETTNAKVVQRISSESLSLKAAVDVRLYNFVNNTAACISLVILSLFFSWQITLFGLVVFFSLMTLLMVLGKKMQDQVGIANQVDDSAKVGF